MNHHNHLEQFASRGLKAQAAVDKILDGAAHPATAGLPTISPACSTAGASRGTACAGELANTRPHTSAGAANGEDMLSQIAASLDTAWLKVVMGSQDYQVGVRSAAQRRLAALHGKRKRNRR